MGTEIERKYLVAGTGWRDGVARSVHIRQGYLATTDKASVRIRIVDDEAARLTVKSAVAGATRAEFEYPIPVKDARALLALCTGIVIEKRRHIVPADALRWEIDAFEGAHAGLVIAEIELPSADTPVPRPDWLGEEVTDDPRYYNATLAAGRPDSPDRDP
jgi:adenylate cyclase